MLAPLQPLFTDWAIWLAVTLLLGGPAAFAAGRALALGWRSFGPGIGYCLILAAVADFLAYALFATPVIPAAAILERITAVDPLGALALLVGWAATALILGGIAYGSWVLTRRRQMTRQYPFLTSAGQG